MMNKGSKSFGLALFLFLLLLLRGVCCWGDASDTGADTGGELNSEAVLVTRSAVIPVPSQPAPHLRICGSADLRNCNFS